MSTAWSGYQAALWDGQQYLLYGKASKLRIDAQGIDVRGNQVRFYDASTIAEWLKAEAHGDTKLAALFERRLMPEMRAVFGVRKRTDASQSKRSP